MKTTKQKLTQDELIRYYEFEFHTLIQKLFTYYSNPIKVYDYIEAVCYLTECSPIILNSIVVKILSGDKGTRPNRYEQVKLYSKIKTIAETCVELHMSKKTYYTYLYGEREVVRGLTEAQGLELIKFFDNTDKLFARKV